MSTQSFRTILHLARTRADYRVLLFSDPALALAGFELTEEEAAILKALRPEDFVGMAGQPEASRQRSPALAKSQYP